MTENSQKKKPLIIESSDSSISSDKSSASKESSKIISLRPLDVISPLSS